MPAMRILRALPGTLLSVGLALSAASPAWAQEEGLLSEENELVPEEAPAPAPAPAVPAAPTGPMGSPMAAAVTGRAPGAYAGVVPGRAQDPAQSRRKKPPRPSVTWIGYQPREGGAARLFIETSVPVTHEQTVQGDVVSITIPGVRLASRNVGRRLDLSAFDGPIASVDVKQARGRAGGVTLRVKLRAGGKQPAVMTEPDPAGYHYLFLDFGL